MCIEHVSEYMNVLRLSVCVHTCVRIVLNWVRESVCLSVC